MGKVIVLAALVVLGVAAGFVVRLLLPGARPAGGSADSSHGLGYSFG